MFKNIMQPSFLGPFDVVGPRHLPTMPIPQPAVLEYDTSLYNSSYCAHSTFSA